MLIRISGGRDGIKEYLEEGRKQGRNQVRDEIDERVILSGDLDCTNEIIQGMDGDGDRYLHITLSFKEDEISHEQLAAITADAREFLAAAYQADEMAFYAEAHLPRLKSYTHGRTGEFVERKPHIHIIIPKKNMLSGGHLNPVGLVNSNLEYIDALQEHINNKYGLASPKDNRRHDFTAASEMISRHKADIFDGQGKELKGSLLAEILEKKIERFEDFSKLVAQRGATRLRNADSPGQYLNVKPEKATRGINLKEVMFSRLFIELPTDEKLRRIAGQIDHKYEVAKEARRSPEHISATLKRWHDVRAREVKYINSGQRTLYAAYRTAGQADRQRLLAEREAKFYTTHQGVHHHEKSHANSAVVEYARFNRFDRQHDPFAARGLSQADTIDGLRNLSSGDVARVDRGGEVLLPDHAPGQLEQQRADGPDALRRLDDSADRVKATGRNTDDVVSQHLRDLRENRQARSAGGRTDFQQVKREIDARRLLDELSHSHGVITTKYEVTKAKDGTDRIRCGTRNLNASDFLTKELNLAWLDAERILRDVHTRQHEQAPTTRKTPERRLWDEFIATPPKQTSSRADAWDAQRASEKARRIEIKSIYKAERSKIFTAGAMKPAQRKATMSIARLHYVEKSIALREQIRRERDAMKTRKGSTRSDDYLVFLSQHAQAGEARAPCVKLL